jgi:hypothetical protein
MDIPAWCQYAAHRQSFVSLSKIMLMLLQLRPKIPQSGFLGQQHTLPIFLKPAPTLGAVAVLFRY